MFKTYNFTQTDEKLIEKLVNVDEAFLAHMVLPQNEQLPEHFSNSKHVFLIVVRGQLSFAVEGETTVYQSGTIVQVPYHTKMLIQNKHEDVLEFFVVKAPHPNTYNAQTE